MERFHYKCQLCGEKIQSREGLRQHIRAKHGQEAAIVGGEKESQPKIKCGGGCDFMAANETTLARHRTGKRCMRRVDEGKQDGEEKGGHDLACGEGCDYVATTKKGLAIHRGKGRCTRKGKPKVTAIRIRGSVRGQSFQSYTTEGEPIETETVRTWDI